MAGRASRENGRKGGRPKGAKSPQTLEREAVAAAFRERVFKKADRLLNAQLTLAEGCSFLFKIVKRGKREEHVIVTDPKEIKAYLDGDLDDEEYRYISTKEPNNQAIDSMLNRTLGKPKETVEVQGNPGPLFAVGTMPDVSPVEGS